MAAKVLSRLNEMRDAYARRRALWRDLAVYTSTDDLNDIEAAIARADADADPQILQIRRILASQRSALAARGPGR